MHKCLVGKGSAKDLIPLFVGVSYVLVFISRVKAFDTLVLLTFVLNKKFNFVFFNGGCFVLELNFIGALGCFYLPPHHTNKERIKPMVE